MNKKEKEQKLQEYEEKVRGLLGHLLYGYKCEFMGDHPVMQVVYFDYKVSIIVRAELQRLLPEVELATVKRLLSRAALLSAIEPLLDCDYAFDHDDGEPLMVKKEWDDDDNEIESERRETPLLEWAISKLYDVDLSDKVLRYTEAEQDERALGTLWDNLKVRDDRHLSQQSNKD